MCITVRYWLYIHATASNSLIARTYQCVVQLGDDAPGDGLVIIRNMQSQVMKNKDHS